MADRGVLPVLFVLDRDQVSLEAVLDGLRRRFDNDFAVRGDVSTVAALAALQQLAAANVPVALFLVDSAASDFLASAHHLHPGAKRVLLVDRDYTSTSPAVQAMTLGQADHHLVRPWTDDEIMYRAMSEYLSSWTREQEPNFELFRIVAAAGDPKSVQLRDVMTRFSMPFGFYPAESDAGQRLLKEAALDTSHLPVVIRYDGQVIIDPSITDLARTIGVNIKNDVDSCDLAILGAGPAGLTAAVYAASEGLQTVVLEDTVSGGQAGSSPLIRNYPGFPHGINGGLLMERTCEQAWLMGAHIVFAQHAVGLERSGDDRIVRLSDGSELRARAVVIATGIEWRRLGVRRLEELVGLGVFYGAAVSESGAMQGQDVYIIGAGNSAGQAALHLANHARTVTLLVRRDSFATSMSNYLVQAIEGTANIVVRHHTEVVDGRGEERLESLTIADRARDTVEEVPAAALFIMIGGEPHTRWLPDEIERDQQGYLFTGRDVPHRSPGGEGKDAEPSMLETSMPGVFAAGDVRYGAMRCVASAVGDGATVVRLIHDYLAERQTEPAAN